MLLKVILEYLLPKKQSQKLLNNLINNLIDQFGEDEFISRFLISVERTFKTKTSKKFKTTEEEVDHDLTLYPQLVPYRLYFINTLKNLRVKHGLNP